MGGSAILAQASKVAQAKIAVTRNRILVKQLAQASSPGIGRQNTSLRREVLA